MRCRFLCAVTLVFLAAATVAQAQNTDPEEQAPHAEQQDHEHAGHDMPGHDMADHEHMNMTGSWSWAADGNAFFGYNYQQRQFADFSAWESQNWFGLTGEHALASGRLSLDGMISLEPFTMHAIGSPQLFQTGESYQRIPLVNYQHPHDLIMNLGATWRVERPRIRFMAGADVVGSPTLGPVPFMHRASARDNPQVPLTHHLLDSTHITPGVVRAGIGTGTIAIETSVFRGEEPDENRLDIDQPRLDSWAGRILWRKGPWEAQFSAGRLHKPEWFEPYNTTRLTASVSFTGLVAGRALAATAAWGENRQSVVANGVSDGFLVEWDLNLFERLAFYGRAEVTEKELFGLGLHPIGFAHPHYYSHVDVLTLGVVRDVLTVRGSRIGIGADITLPHMSPDLLEYWAGSRSYHVFARWRPTGAGHHH